MSSRTRTAAIGADPDDRWGPAEYLAADRADWLQTVFLAQVAAASSKKPPKFRPYPRPTDLAIRRARQAQRRRDEEANRVALSLLPGIEGTPGVTGPPPAEV